MAERSRYWSPSRTYEFELKIGKWDLTPDLVKLKIITSIDLPYQTFILQFYSDSNDFIAEQIFGQKPIKLKAFLLSTEQFPLETIDFDLMYVSSDISMNNQIQNPANVQKDRTPITITAVSRNAYKTMNTIVNDIFQGQRIETVIKNLVASSGATIDYDPNDQNADVIDQILVPPSTLYKTLHYINRTWGIFNGAPAIFCTYDNKVHIKNLTSKMRQAQAFTLYQLAIDADNEKIIDQCNDGKHFYTLHDLQTKYEGNSVFSVLAPTMRYVVKPRDRFISIIDVDLETFAKQYGLIAKNKEIFFDKDAINPDTRISIHKDHTGYELSTSFIASNVAKKISSITDMNAIVERSLKLFNLMEVGEPVQVTSKSNEVEKLTGKYILGTSELRFDKVKDWESSCVIGLIRTNRLIN